MGERRDDLHATAEDLIADAEQLKRIEERKLELAQDDPAMDRLAAESRELVHEIEAKTRAESQLADEPEAG